MKKGIQIGMIFFEAAGIWLPVRSESDQKLTNELEAKILSSVSVSQSDFGEYYIYVSKEGTITKLVLIT